MIESCICFYSSKIRNKIGFKYFDFFFHLILKVQTFFLHIFAINSGRGIYLELKLIFLSHFYYCECIKSVDAWKKKYFFKLSISYINLIIISIFLLLLSNYVDTNEFLSYKFIVKVLIV